MLGAAALIIATDQHCSAAGFARCIDVGAAEQADALAQHPHPPATDTGRGTRCIQRSAYLHHAAAAAIEIDFAVAPADAPRPHHAIHVQHGIEEGVPGAGLQRHPTTIGDDLPGVLDQRRHGTCIHLIPYEAVTVEIDVDPLTGDEAGRSTRRDDGAGVAHPGADQCHAAAFGRGNPALVAHAARPSWCYAEHVAATQQIGTAGGEGGCHQAAHIDHRITAKYDA